MSSRREIAVEWLELRAGRIVWLLASLIVICGAGYSFSLGDRLYFPDESEYLEMASSLAEKGAMMIGGKKTATHPPGYPLMLAPLTVLCGDPRVLRLLNFLFLGGTIGLIYHTVRRCSRPWTGLIAAGLTAGYPVLFYTAGTFYPQTAAGFLYMLTMLQLTRLERMSTKGFFLLGLTLGILVLTVSTFIWSCAVIFFWILWVRRRSVWKGLLMMTLVAALPTGIWTVRNFRTFDALFFLSTRTGYALLMAHSENTTPALSTVDISAYRAEAEARGLNEAETDAYFKNQAVAYIRAHKRQAISMYLYQLINYFNFRNRLQTSANASILKDLIMLGSYGPLLLLFLWRLVLFRRYPPSPQERLWILLYLSTDLFLSLFFTRIRYRLPLDLLCIAVASTVLSGSLRSRGRTSDLKREACHEEE